MGPIWGRAPTGSEAALAVLVLALPDPALAADRATLIMSFDKGRLLVLTALAAGAVALAIAASLWALAEQANAKRLARMLRAQIARGKGTVAARDALLDASRGALVVRQIDGSATFSYGGGEVVLQSCLKGGEGERLEKALIQLSGSGNGFEFSVTDGKGRLYV
ncbi:MAG: hypothetical protein ACREFW_01330, partial [Rhizomicrobium sp.]